MTMLPLSLFNECLYHSVGADDHKPLKIHCLALAGLSFLMTRGMTAPSQRVERM